MQPSSPPAPWQRQVLHLVCGVTLPLVPTLRPRHVVTETDPVARALADAAKRWPDQTRPQLLLRLIEEGHRAVAGQQARGVAAQRAAVQRTSGALDGAYGEGYLGELRRDWPA